LPQEVVSSKKPNSTNRLKSKAKITVILASNSMVEAGKALLPSHRMIIDLLAQKHALAVFFN